MSSTRRPGTSPTLKTLYLVYIAAFFLFLFVPLLINGVLAFNDNPVPSFPWKGATTGWFYSTAADQVGVFNDAKMMRAILTSLKVSAMVTGLSLLVGTMSAFVFIREKFRGQQLFYIVMILPLVVPGVILGISILVFSNSCIHLLRAVLGPGIAPLTRWLRPGLLLVVLGQFCFIGTIATLVISARLRKFPQEQEEAAMDLGASRWGAVFSVTLPFLTPALFSAGVLAFLLSFENFATTLFLIGSEPTLPIFLFSRLRFLITPEINAISVILMVFTSLLGLAAVTRRSRRPVE
jgi:spermidine/putrescine transport system permease protein